MNRLIAGPTATLRGPAAIGGLLAVVLAVAALVAALAAPGAAGATPLSSGCSALNPLDGNYGNPNFIQGTSRTNIFNAGEVVTLTATNPSAAGVRFAIEHVGVAVVDGAAPATGSATISYTIPSTGTSTIFFGAGPGFAHLEVSCAAPGFNFTGFFSPVNNPTDPDPVNSVKAGASVPVKFSLSGNQGLNVLAADYPKLEFYACNPGDDVDPPEETSTANNGLTYDALTDTYTYVWKTSKNWKGKCGTFTLQLSDGSVHTAEFQFK